MAGDSSNGMFGLTISPSKRRTGRGRQCDASRFRRFERATFAQTSGRAPRRSGDGEESREARHLVPGARVGGVRAREVAAIRERDTGDERRSPPRRCPPSEGHGRIRTHASAQALLERARPAHAVDPETDGEPSDRERPREEAKTRKDRKDHGALVPEESSGKTQPPGNVSASCLGVAGVEYAGEVVEGGWGADATRGFAASASACCARCRARATCNVWVFCDPDETRCREDALAGQCWLKRQTLARRARAGGDGGGGGTPWTSGADRRFDEEAVEIVPRIDLSEWFKPLDAARRTPRYGDESDGSDGSASVGEKKPPVKKKKKTNPRAAAGAATPPRTRTPASTRRAWNARARRSRLWRCFFKTLRRRQRRYRKRRP